MELGKGRTLEEIVSSTRMIAEGVRTTESAKQLADKYGVDAPICTEVYRVIYEGKPINDAVTDLLLRPPRSEHEFGDLIAAEGEDRRR